MEAVEDPPVQNTIESVKNNNTDAVLVAEASLCLTTNGDAELTTAPLAGTETGFPVQEPAIQNSEPAHEAVHETQPHDTAAAEAVAEDVEALVVPDSSSSLPLEEMIMDTDETHAAVEKLLSESHITEEITEEVIVTSIDTSDAILCNEVTLEGTAADADSVEISPDKVTLRTEVLVEKSEDDVPNSNDEPDHANSLLNELSQGTALSEALRSADTTDLGENNNGSIGEEVFNKKELLDILEGNDQSPLSTEQQGNDQSPLSTEQQEQKAKRRIETQIALQQLSRLHNHRNQKRGKVETSKLKKKGRKKVQKVINNSTDGEVQENVNTSSELVEDTEETQENKNISIVNTLVKDWDDDDVPEAEQSKQLLQESENLLMSAEKLVKSQASTGINQEATSTTTDSPSVEGTPTGQNKSMEDGQPQRRLGRVIKKKVPFDPDNPDTFTKGKIIKKEIATEKEQQSPVKKIKTEPTPQRAKSKSPTSKMQWKKPVSKTTCKQNKRLTEVDKLLMDEGAVNMIYQLTPEAPKGKKNMRTKAEIIKKMQSSTPDGNKDTMKFRERKKEAKNAEGEAKKILGGKSSRLSLSGSMKSPSVCEDFETHSADDSIIYRRHSSSSYSSACMSPRRLSDNEANSTRASQPPKVETPVPQQDPADNDKLTTDIFMADATPTGTDIINKDDCLSIKEKLNNKLSLVLNKRKRESTTKTEKPAKKRASKNSTVEKESNNKFEDGPSFKYITVSFDQRLADICVKDSQSIYNVEILKDLEQALLYIDSKKDISTTFLTSESGTLCSELDLTPLLSDKMETRTNYGHAIAEAVRSLLCAVESHSKLLVVGVWGACRGAALAVAALGDVALGSEHATFALAPQPQPGVAALTTRCSRLSQSLINDLLVFGRCVSGAEAVQGGLLSRCVPGAGPRTLRTIAADLAHQPLQSILLKKQLLNLNKSSDSESTFLTGLERERDLLVQYWTSVEGQESLRARKP